MNVKNTVRRLMRDHDSYGEDADEWFATAHGLRQLADLLEDEPDSTLPSITIWDTTYDKDHAKAVEHLRGKAARFGGKWEKSPSGGTFYLIRRLGGKVEYRLGAPREAICTKRVVGSHMVQRPKAPPSYLTIETETVREDVVEWDCPEVIR